MKINLFAPDTRQPWQPRGEFAPVAATPANSIPQSATPSNSFNSPEWWSLRAAIMTALQNYPEAREHLVRTLRAINAPEEPHAPTI